jgi:tRNA(Arg) A34 adenosine deaminase TadA
MITHIQLSIPDSIAQGAASLVASTPEERMAHVIQWSQENIQQQGGPFAAGIFDLSSGACIAVGVNRVVDSGCSVAHAEMMAIMLAQQSLETHDLSTRGQFVLTTSAQPCSQCFGALPWSGIAAMEFGADRASVENIGFDEGPYPENWKDNLAQRGIKVSGPILGEKALDVLLAYQANGGDIY